MEIGSKDLISATYSVFDDVTIPFVEGTLSYFVRGEQIGESDRVIILEDICTSLICILGDKGRRRSDDLYQAPARDVMLSLDTELYSVSHDLEYTKISLPEEPARFDLTLTIETFDGWRLYLIDGAESSRLIYHRFDWETPREAEIPLGLVDIMLEELSRQIEQIVKSYK